MYTVCAHFHATRLLRSVDAGNDNVLSLLGTEFDVFEAGFKFSFQLSTSGGKNLAGDLAGSAHTLTV